MALTDLINRVKQSRLGQAVSNLDRDREKPGFQLFSPQTRRNVSTTLNAGPYGNAYRGFKGIYNTAQEAGKALGDRQDLINQRTSGMSFRDRLFRPSQQDEKDLFSTGLQKSTETIGSILAPRHIPVAVASGALGYGATKLSGGSNREALDNAITAGKSAPVYSAIAGLTNPYISKLLPNKAGFVANRAAPAVGNIAQGIGIDLATGQKTTPTSLAIDAVTGLAGGKNQFTVGKGITNKGKKNVIELETRINDVLNRYDSQFGSAKTSKKSADIEMVAEAEELWKRVFGRDKKAPASLGQTVGDLYDALQGIKQENLMKREGIKLGLVGGQSAKGYADSPKFSSLLDQKPRFEIDDSGAELKVDAVLKMQDGQRLHKLDDLLDHKQLFKNYPQLKNIGVVVTDDNSIRGNYDPTNKIINLSQKARSDKSTLLHEIQHAIQEIEGFARGGSPESANGLLRQANLEKTGKLNKQLQEYREKNWDVLSKYRKDLDELNRNPEVRRLLRLADEASNKRDFKSSEKYLAEANKYDVPSPPERIKELELVREIQKLERERGRILDFMGGDSYKRLSGELEARAVQRRMDLPQDQRLRVDPYADEAIATTGKADPNEFITRFDSGRSMSEPDPTEALKIKDGKYKTIHSGGEIKEVDAKPIKIIDGIDTIIHKDPNGNWTVSEVSTGRSLIPGGFSTKAVAIKEAKNAIEKNLEILGGMENMTKMIRDTAESTGLYNQAKVDQPGPLKTNQQTPTVKTSTQNRPIAEISDKQVKQEAISELRRTESRQRYTDKVPYSLEDSVAHLPNMTSDNALKHKVTFLDYFRTPDRVLEKIGLGKQAKELRNAQQNYSQRLPKEIDRVTQWYERVGRSDDASKRIFQYLDGQKGVRLRPEEKQVANEMRQYLSSWADELGLPKDKRIANYITHIFENDFINKEFDPELEKIIADKVPGSVYDPFLQKRLGKQGYVEDAFRAMDAYVKRATRKSSMDPALESLKKASDKLPLQSWNYIKNYADRVNLRPTDIDNLFDTFIKQSPIGGRLGQRPVANVTRKVRNATYRGTLGLNVGSALRNLTQGANTYSQLGERYTARGYFDALRAIFGKSDELDRVGVTADSFIQDRNLSSKKQLLQKFDQGLWYMFDMAEKVNRGAAYFGAKARALSKGKSMQEAIDEGIDMARKTQFTFGAVDTPVALQGDVAKTLLQFQSYNIKQLEFLGELVSEKNVAGIVRYLGAWALFASVAGDVMGMDIKDAIPFSSEITEGKTRIGQTPAIKAVTGTYKALLNAPGRYGDDPKDTLIGRLKQQDVPDQLGAAFVPGFVQGKKTFEGIKTAKQGYSESAGGRVRTPVEQTTSNLIKGALFGQYSNKQVREYFDENRTVLGEKQTDIFKKILDSKGMQAASEYYDSVIQQREIDRNIEDIKSGIKTSNPDTDKITTKQAVDLIKAEIEAGVDVSETDLYTAYLNKEIKMPQTNRYEKSQRDSKLWSKAGTIIDDEDLSDAQKQVLKEKIASELGRPVEDLETYQVAKQNNDTKTLYAYDQIDTFKTNDEFMRFLVQGRKPINGEIIIADGVITNLVNDGIISEQLGKELKNLDLNEDGTVKKKKKKSGRSSKTRTAYNNYFKALAKVGTSRTKIKGVKVGDINFSLGL